ncbi:acyl-CoA dehydrogenase [Uncinocarpus reesii 1704]|uniref:Acyl-CoA dehydrogenase n=1 Tax=Uncinocarpus reesii (strain UAMH 1704) TaxID=336963 RepID=C4JNK5_UNCRE|nr:acyl-CoA dehydrogenase [Uncinocarpus reesii 1704]EEP78158.1 acyl-CoA dehydrogenase [Uncinocarpus reesii 1704]
MAPKLFPRSLRSLASRRFPASQHAAHGQSILRSSLPPVRAFSASSPSRIMDVSCFRPDELFVRDAISKICAKFPDEYWAERDETGEYPHELHAALAKDGWIGIALPEELGGAGLGIAEATMMLQTIAQTEPNTGLETLKLRTTAVRDGDYYKITGQKIWISSAQVAKKMVLLARTTPLEEVTNPTRGLSLFFIDFDKDAPGLELRKIKKMGGRSVDANEVFFNDYRIPADTLIGKEGQGFKIVLHGMNAERCLLAGEALGLGYVALEKAVKYAKERVVFGRPIGQNQGIAHPLATAFMNLEAAKLATYHAARLYDENRGEQTATPTTVGVACNSAKFLAAEAAFAACERAVLTLGGMGYAQEFHVERYLRECFVPRIAPISQEMIKNFVSEKMLDLPRSY